MVRSFMISVCVYVRERERERAAEERDTVTPRLLSVALCPN